MSADDPHETVYTETLTNAFKSILAREREFEAAVARQWLRYGEAHASPTTETRGMDADLANLKGKVVAWARSASGAITHVPRRLNRHERRAAAARNR